MKPKKNAVTKSAVPAPAKPGKAFEVGSFPVHSLWSDRPIDYACVSMNKKAALETFGTDSEAAIIGIVNSIILAQGGLADGAWLDLALNTIRAMKPRDVMEAQLFAQLVLLHYQMARMISISRQDGIDWNITFKAVATAREISKTYQGGMETVGRYRTGGQQQIIVSHVNVQDGAQAAFSVGGDVNGGGGCSDA